MHIADYVKRIDLALERSFPPEVERHNEDWPNESSGPDHHVLCLRISRDFYEDEDDGAAAMEAGQQIETDYQALVEALTARWGSATALSMIPFFIAVEQEEMVAQGLDLVCETVSELQVWGRGPRWVGVGFGQRARKHRSY